MGVVLPSGQRSGCKRFVSVYINTRFQTPKLSVLMFAVMATLSVCVPLKAAESVNGAKLTASRKVQRLSDYKVNSPSGAGKDWRDRKSLWLYCYPTETRAEDQGRVARQRPSRFTAKVTESPPVSFNSARMHWSTSQIG